MNCNSFFHISSRTATTQSCFFSAPQVTAKPVTNGGLEARDHNFHRVADCAKLFSTKPKTRLGCTRKIGSPMLRGSILYFFL